MPLLKSLRCQQAILTPQSNLRLYQQYHYCERKKTYILNTIKIHEYENKTRTVIYKLRLHKNTFP